LFDSKCGLTSKISFRFVRYASISSLNISPDPIVIDSQLSVLPHFQAEATSCSLTQASTAWTSTSGRTEVGFFQIRAQSSECLLHRANPLSDLMHRATRERNSQKVVTCDEGPTAGSVRGPRDRAVLSFPGGAVSCSGAVAGYGR